MPELPEVEVVKRSLEKMIINLTIKSVKINDPNLRYKVKKRDVNQIIGLKILNIKRRSKNLLFFFNKKRMMIVHLGMTGKFFILNKGQTRKKTSFYYNLNKKKDNKHNHIVFTFDKNLQLIYNDVRKFGFIKFDHIKNAENNQHLKNLGPEPLENIFNFKYVKNYLKGRNRTIKDLLMDQKFVSGLGNIYVNEILYYSNIKPIRKVITLDDFEIKRIITNTKKILKKAILQGGSSIKNFSDSSGETGSFQQYFSVYGRIGEKCSNPDCNFTIVKIIISNRASFFCPKCQK